MAAGNLVRRPHGMISSAMPTPDLSPEDLRRYSRQIVLPELGPEGQKKLKAARVLVVGVGGLGAPLSLYLTAAGVGTLGLVDHDAVELANLHRQVLYSGESVGRPKLAEAEARLKALNSGVRIIRHEERLTSRNALDIIRDYDVVADGTDNFPTRYLVNDACVLAGKPNVYAAVFRFEGRLSVFDGRKGPCYRCLFPQPPAPGTVPDCAAGGVLGALPGGDGLAAGHRGRQAHPGCRRAGHRKARGLRRALHGVADHHHPQGPALPALRQGALHPVAGGL